VRVEHRPSTSIRIGLLCATALVLAAPAVAAQTRGGLWFGGGIGLGFGRARCDVCMNDRNGAISGYARLGGTISPAFLLGIEADGWTRSEEDLRFDMGAIHAVGLWYPSPTSPWFVKVGFGVIGYRLDDDDGDEDQDDAITAFSVGGQFGAGYDLHLAGGVSVTPFVNFLGSIGAELKQQDDTLADVSLTLIQIGLGLTLN
jgi:hypothetical protein